jgi:hypothetical protein
MADWSAIIAVEGEVSVDGRLVRPGAFTWETPLPLMSGGTAGDEFSRPIIGTVQDITRIIGEDGRNLLRATGIAWRDLDPALGPSVSAVGGEFDTQLGEAGRLIFTHAEIKAVFLGQPVWPDVRFEEG